MPRPASTWAREAAAVFAKEWRSELRTRYALNTLALFAINTLVVVSASLGPLGAAPGRSSEALPVLLWLILLFAAAAGLPRAFVHEEETQTATALRLSATPSALFCGKLAYAASVLAALEALVAPLFLAVMNLDVARPGLLAATLAAGGFGLAAGSTLVAAIIAQARGQATLFAVLSFPVLLPLLLLAVELTGGAFGVGGGAAAGAGGPGGPGGSGVAMVQLLLYDGAVTTAGLMLFPVVWNP